jgi:hypothetical protein
MYLLLMVSGIFAFTYKSPAVSQYLQPWVLAVWASFFTFGGFASAFGILKGNWAGEAVGLPFLGSALSVYGTALVWSGFSRSNSVAVVTGIILLAFAIGILGRWRESRRMLRIARDT